ncbi:MAG: Gfo/Idh/MocA family oxidoreductase [Candidatus Brocadiales bacterium]|nr:Gfo/Idh/MocA family oxidoreductase [Candidatus Brocadiales bacterium]
MKIIVLGAGMYVTGRNKTGVGTVLSALSQLSKEVTIEKVSVIASSTNSAKSVDSAINRINKILNSSLQVDYYDLEQNTIENLFSNENYDCTIIATPDNLHYQQALLSFQNCSHVLCVKPLVVNTAENKELIKLQIENNLLGMVEYHKRYDEANLYTKKIINDGSLGNLLYYQVDYSQRIGIPMNTFKNWINNTDIFQYLGVHYVDLFYFLTEYIPVRLTAYGTDGILKENGIDTYDSIHVSIIWKRSDGGECITTFNTNWIDPDCTSALSDQKYKLVGTKGRIENDHKNRGIEVVTDEDKIQHPNPYFSDYLFDANGNSQFSGYGYQSIRQFITDVRDVTSSIYEISYYENKRPTFKQAMISTAVIESVHKSLTNKSNWESINVHV